MKFLSIPLIPFLVLCPIIVLAGKSTPEIADELPAASSLPDPVGGEIPVAEQQEIRQPLILTLRGGREFEGTLSGFDGELVSVRSVEEGGEVVLSFPSDEITEIYFPGERILTESMESVEAGDLEQALPYLEALLVSRYPLFPIITEEQRAPFVKIPQAALAIQRPAAAIAYVEALRPFIEDPGSMEELRDAELLGRYMLDLNDTAKVKALEWIDDQNRFPESALGFFVLAAIAFEEDAYEDSLYTALRPVVFSGQIPVPYLSHCYSLAIASTHLLGHDSHRDKLIAEMEERGLSWQPLLALRSANEDLEDLVILDPQGNRLPLFEASTGSERLIENLNDSVGGGDLLENEETP